MLPDQRIRKRKKGGSYKDAACKEPATKLLQGEYVLAQLTQFKASTLYCAEINLSVSGVKAEDGYYTNSTCDTTLAEAEKNKSDFTEVIVPQASTPLPNIRIALPGETYPLNLGGSLSSKSELRNEAFASQGTEFSILLHIAESTALGTAVIDFLRRRMALSRKMQHAGRLGSEWRCVNRRSVPSSVR